MHTEEVIVTHDCNEKNVNSKIGSKILITEQFYTRIIKNPFTIEKLRIEKNIQTKRLINLLKSEYCRKHKKLVYFDT